MTRDNAQKLLDVHNGCSEDDIKKAYKRLAMIHHPDKGGTEHNFKLLLEARDTLLASIKKNSARDPFRQSYTKEDFETIRANYRSTFQERLRRLQELKDLNEKLSAYEAKQKAHSNIEKSLKIKAVLWVAFATKALVCVFIGFYSLQVSVITLIIFIWLLYSSKFIADAHDGYLRFKNRLK